MLNTKIDIYDCNEHNVLRESRRTGFRGRVVRGQWLPCSQYDSSEWASWTTCIRIKWGVHKKCRPLRAIPDPNIKSDCLWEWSPDTDPGIGSMGKVMVILECTVSIHSAEFFRRLEFEKHCSGDSPDPPPCSLC